MIFTFSVMYIILQCFSKFHVPILLHNILHTTVLWLALLVVQLVVQHIFDTESTSVLLSLHILTFLQVKLCPQRVSLPNATISIIIK